MAKYLKCNITLSYHDEGESYVDMASVELEDGDEVHVDDEITIPHKYIDPSERDMFLDLSEGEDMQVGIFYGFLTTSNIC